jgi:uncharacterized protein (DUF2132 family)
LSQEQPNDPLHGITLKAILEDLVERRGWEDLSGEVRIRCFSHEPTINSSLKFLRKTPWARTEVEELYIWDQRRIDRNRERNQGRAERRTRGAESKEEDAPPETET